MADEVIGQVIGQVISQLEGGARNTRQGRVKSTPMLNQDNSVVSDETTHGAPARESSLLRKLQHFRDQGYDLGDLEELLEDELPRLGGGR